MTPIEAALGLQIAGVVLCLLCGLIFLTLAGVLVWRGQMAAVPIYGYAGAVICGLGLFSGLQMIGLF